VAAAVAKKVVLQPVPATPVPATKRVTDSKRPA
jgi:hypothetical protein